MKTIMKYFLVFLTTGCLCWQPAFSQTAGPLDSLFGVQGKAVIDAGAGFIQPAATVFQGDGKMVALGTFYQNNEPDYHNFILVSYRPDGSLDTTFGDRGRTITDLKGRDYATSLAVQKDGKIVACGYSWDNGYYWSLARYQTDGRPDSSFGVAGRTFIGFTGSANSNQVFALPDGRIMVAGTVQYAPTMSLWTYARFLPNGQPDPDFGGDGKLDDLNGALTAAVLQDSLHFLAIGNRNGQLVVMRHDIDGIPDPTFGDDGLVTIADTTQAATVTVQPDQEILVSGYFGDYQQEQLLLARLHPDGTPDPAFGNNGVATARSPFRNLPHELSLRDDGSIVLAGIGDTVLPYTLWYDFRLARFLADGRPDTTFGPNGSAVLARSEIYDDVVALSVRPDGNMLVTGVKNWNFCLTRHFPDGSLDPGFGSKGITETEFMSPPSDDQAEAMAIQPDGRILVSGRSYFLLSYDALLRKPYITRLLPNGAPDTTFAIAGTLRAMLPGILLAVQPDHKTVVAGHQALRRFLSDGRPDTTFGQNGLTWDYRLSEADLAVQPDGRIVLSGSSSADNGGSFRFALARYLSDGSPDPGFGSNGLASVSFGPSSNSVAQAVKFLPDGKILACGYTDVGSPVKFALARLQSDGTPDPAFGTNGTVTTGFTGNAYAYRLAILPDGKILLGGQMLFNTLAMARYLPDGSPDPAFGNAGQLTVPDIALVNDMAVDSAGRILVAADYQEVNNAYFTVYRFLASGVPDASFGTNGRLSLDFGLKSGTAKALAVLPGGNILAVGHAGGDIVVVRLLGSPKVGVLNFSNPVQEVLVYPNPVGDTGLLEFELQDATELSVTLYDLSGRPVRTLSGRQHFPAGKHQVAIRMGDLPAGGYVVVVEGEKGKVAVRVLK